jgi:hypothetical protein
MAIIVNIEVRGLKEVTDALRELEKSLSRANEAASKISIGPASAPQGVYGGSPTARKARPYGIAR